MSLSEQERRLFEELERDFVAEPGHVRVRRRTLSHAVNRATGSWLVLLFGLVCGAGLLAQALSVSAGAAAILGVLGYVVIVFSTVQSVPAARRATSRRRVRTLDTNDDK